MTLETTLATTTTPGAGPPAGAFHHGRRSAFNAWFFATLDRLLASVTGEHKRHAFAGLDAPEVVEIGAGVGANLDRLRAGARLVAIEPNLAMHNRLQARASARGVELRIVPTTAEALPLEDASVDEVVGTLVLCTIPDPAAALAEVHRVLRPGGRFRFVEHVAAPRWSPRRWLQHAVRRPWGWVFEGCDPCRDTSAAIHRAGFSQVELRRRRFRRSPFLPVNTAISGIATR